MDFSKNLHIRCTNEEAIELAHRLTINEGLDITNCYFEAFDKLYKSGKNIQQYELCNIIYTLGFLSGSRAIRERNKQDK